MINIHNQHLHTKYSRDSKTEVEKYFIEALRANCMYFICTDHIEFDSVYNKQDWTVDFESLKNDLNILHQKYPSITPLLGVELGYRKDKLTQMKGLLASQDFDLVNMSIHDNGVYDYYLQKDYLEVGIEKMLDIYFNNIIDGVKTFNDYDILSHVDYGFKTAYLLDQTLKIENYETYLKIIFEEIVKQNKVLEINFKVQETINDINHLKTLLQLYKKYGGTKISFSSDAHTLEQEQSYYLKQKEYINIFKELGFNELYYFIKRKPYKFSL